MPSRRAVLAGALATPVAATALSADLAAPRGRASLRIAAGEEGGLYAEFARLLARSLDSRESPVRLRVLRTSGTEQNLELLRRRRADLALGLSDVVHETLPALASVHALSRIYENYLQLVVDDGSTIRRVADLRGESVVVGAAGSGAARLSRQILQLDGFPPVRAVHAPLARSAELLRRGEVAGSFWSGGLPTPAWRRLDHEIGLRLLDLGGLVEALRRRTGYPYVARVVPPVDYNPIAGTTTIGVPNLLMVRSAVHPGWIAEVTRALIESPDSIVPTQSRGLQYLRPAAMIQTGDVPLHPAAVAVYRAAHG